MPIEITAVAVAATTILAPFTPYLIDTAKAVGEAFATTLAEQGGEAAWQCAQTLWSKLTARFQGDQTLTTAAAATALNPSDDDFRKKLATALSERLSQAPDLAAEIEQLLGGRESVQEVIATQGSWIEDVLQSGDGTKLVKADDNSTIKGVRQQS
jgi:hypothetical protein